MFNRITHLLTSLYVYLRTSLRVRVVEPARGLGMLEYALMALVVVVIFGAIATFLPGFIGGILQDTSNKKVTPTAPTINP